MKEETWIKHVADGSMPREDAEILVEGIDEVRSIDTRAEYIRHIAAMRAKWPDEGERRLPNGAATLRQILLNGCSLARIEWLLNFRRYIAEIEHRRGRDIAAGTTSNEAFHRELNNIFDLVHEMHQATVLLKLRIILFMKAIPHARATQGELLRQRRPQRVLNRVIHAVQLWSDESWHDWCMNFVGDQRIKRMRSSLGGQRHRQEAAVRRWKAKRPASVRDIRKAANRRIRRTPFQRRTGITAILRRPASIMKRPMSKF